MTPFGVSVIIALVWTAALAVLVFCTNPRRSANRGFLLLSVIVGAWLTSVGAAAISRDAGRAELWIRLSSMLGALIPAGFNILRLSILQFDKPFSMSLRGARYWLLCHIALIALCLTPFYLHGVTIPYSPHVPPEAQYGYGFYLYAAYFVIASILVIAMLFRDVRSGGTLQRIELQFVLLGCCAGLLTGSVFLLMPLFTSSGKAIQFFPLSVISLYCIIAYGIATRRIMEVPDFLRRLSAYVLLTCYLIGLYLAVWQAAALALRYTWPTALPVAQIIAAIVTAFSMAPAHGRLQRFANRLFITAQPLDIGSTMQNAHKILQSITTLQELLERFADSMAVAVGTDRVVILLKDKSACRQQHPVAPPEQRIELAENDPLLLALQHNEDPVVAETIQRSRPTDSLLAASRRLLELDASVAIGIHSKRGLEGVLLLGPRLSGRIYGAVEQDTLQILCNQLAVALENAKLYTQVQDSKIYNDILLDNLVSGVAAANAEGLITVFNREAQRITNLRAADVINHSVNVLPSPLARALQLTFQRGYGLRDQEMSVHHASGEDIPIRVGSSLFRGHEGHIIGALLVFEDVTTIKKLELQVRRTDRLASLGTLAAGMAHEIKNPLVTIKTFTQLLPERYEDNDFRDTFSSLIGQEVRRIDSIVNQLLKFSRPTKPTLTPSSLHEVLENTLNLLSEQIRQRNITLNCSFKADNDVVDADPDQLNQAFVNFILNASESMPGGGELAVSTEIVRSDLYSTSLWRERNSEGHIRLCIRDSGSGIPRENLARIFDPFFTTKSHGTGLGLSVAHGIIQEHGGVIDVESEPGRGTTFFVVFPLVRKEALV